MRLRKLARVVVVIAIVLCGCTDESNIPVKRNTEKLESRFSIESKGSFSAGYQHQSREVLILTDSKTGRQYLLVTGCGATEYFQSGKYQVEE